MYQYTESGLDNVWLTGGYRVEETPYGNTVVIENEAALVRLVAEHLIGHKRQLSGVEFRFLRNVMGLTQTELGAKVGKKLLTVSRWEGGDTPIPAWADRMIRQLCLEHLGRRPRLADLIEATPGLPDDPSFEFEYDDGADGRWTPRTLADAHRQGQTSIPGV